MEQFYQQVAPLLDLFKGIVMTIILVLIYPLYKRLMEHDKKIEITNVNVQHVKDSLEIHCKDNKEDFREVKVDLKEIALGVRKINGKDYGSNK